MGKNIHEIGGTKFIFIGFLYDKYILINDEK